VTGESEEEHSGMAASDRTASERPRLTYNTHLHVPPNFSAFTTVEDAVETSAREGVKVIGTSNFHDFGVYDRFEAAAKQHGLAALFGLEFISVLEDEQRNGVMINDPANPGRAYICGKGIPAPTSPSAETAAFMASAKTSNEDRTSAMIDLIRDLFAKAGLEVDVTYQSIVDAVSLRADVPAEWVVLQERHVALGFQVALFEALAVDARAALLEKVYGQAPTAGPDDAGATQGELRSRLMKAGRPAFVKETPVPFSDALDFIRGLGAIAVYPTVADGADPICGYEDPVEDLIERMTGHDIYGAELIPVRNTPAVVDEYVKAWRDAGIFVMVGTEHNTQERIPVAPTCLKGVELSDMVRDITWEGTCVVAAHQHLKRQGKAGYTDVDGVLNPTFPDAETRIRYFAEMGEELLFEATGTVR
jgi:hypothetical protein